MEPETQVEETPGTTPETIIEAPSQTPIEQELDRENKVQRTEADKAAFSLRKNAERAKELGIDPAEVLGFTQKPKGLDEYNEDTPVTVGMLEKLTKERGLKSAIELADEIPDQHERALTKKYLEERVKPSGDPYEDLRFARLAVNSVKNSQIAEEITRASQPRSAPSGAGAPPKPQEREPEFTAQELGFMRPPFNMTKEDIMKARKSAEG